MKKAMVTGASEGIGRAFALSLAARGYAVTAVARTESRLQSLLTEMSSTGVQKHDILIADISTTEGVAQVANYLQIHKHHLLINNAGFSEFGAFFKTDITTQQNIMRVNCEAVVILSHRFLLNAVAGDAIVNVSSTLAFLPMPAQAVYSASKAFVTSFSDSLWWEQRKRGIYVLAVCPGVTDSEFYTRAGGQAQHRPSRFITQQPQTVVETTLTALEKRQNPGLISGVFNKAAYGLAKILPRKYIVSLMGRMR